MNQKQLLKLAIQNTLFYKAYIEIGVYPASSISNGIETKRTVYQDGWNDALQKISKNFIKITSWWGKLTEETRKYLTELLLADQVVFDFEDKEITPWIIFNDTFGYACADGEDIPLEDLPLITFMYKSFDYTGLIAWASFKRKTEPIEEWQTDKYKFAKLKLSQIITNINRDT